MNWSLRLILLTVLALVQTNFEGLDEDFLIAVLLDEVALQGLDVLLSKLEKFSYNRSLRLLKQIKQNNSFTQPSNKRDFQNF